MAKNTVPTKSKKEVQMIHHMRSMLYREFAVLQRSSKYHKMDVNRWGVSAAVDDPGRGGHFGGYGEDDKLKKAKATDIYLDADVEEEYKIGNGLFEAFVKYRKELGISYVIWNEQQSTRQGTFVEYTVPADKPKNATWKHTNHLHVEFDAVEGDKDHSAMLQHVISGVAIDLNKKKYAHMVWKDKP